MRHVYSLHTDQKGTNVSFTARGKLAAQTAYQIVATHFSIPPTQAIERVVQDDLRDLAAWSRNNPLRGVSIFMANRTLRVQIKLIDPQMPVKPLNPDSYIRGELGFSMGFNASEDDVSVWLRVHNVKWVIPMLNQFDYREVISYQDGTGKANLWILDVKTRLEAIASKKR